MTDDAVWDAFCTRLAAFAGGYSPALQVIYQGVGGVPPETGIWLEARFFPNRTRNYGVGASEAISLIGFCQVTVCNRPGAGLNPSLDLVAAVIAYFDTATVLGPAYVNQPPYASSAIDESDRVMVPVTIPYAAHGSR